MWMSSICQWHFVNKTFGSSNLAPCGCIHMIWHLLCFYWFPPSYLAHCYWMVAKTPCAEMSWTQQNKKIQAGGRVSAYTQPHISMVILQRYYFCISLYIFWGTLRVLQVNVHLKHSGMYNFTNQQWFVKISHLFVPRKEPPFPVHPATPDQPIGSICAGTKLMLYHALLYVWVKHQYGNADWL